LLKKFVQVRGDGVRWAIANALVYLGFSRQSWDEILRLAADTSYGGGRQNLVKRLHRIKSPAVEPTLLSLLDDPDVDAFAASSLGRRGGQRALAKLQSLDLSGRSVLTKREVPKAIERLRRRLDAA
jgi:HEAT repeat protein